MMDIYKIQDGQIDYRNVKSIIYLFDWNVLLRLLQSERTAGLVCGLVNSEPKSM